MIFVYGDESMDETLQRTCAVAAVVGTQDQWNATASKWTARNAGVPFHAKDCESDRGIYRNRSHSENKALYKDSVVLIAESELYGYAAVIDLIGMRKVYPSSELPNRMYFRGLLEVWDAMSAFALHAEEIAELTFDSRPTSDHNAALMYAHLRENTPRWRERLAPRIAFDSGPCVQLEIADLFAHEAMKHLDNKIGPKKRLTRASWTALHGTSRFKLRVFGEADFRDLHLELNDGKSHYKALLMGYPQWLKKKRRQDNLTNLFEFLNSRSEDNSNPA